MDLIEEQHAAVRLFDEARLRLLGTCERALDVAEDMRDQELRIVVVIRAVERHERRVLRKALHGLAVLEHHMGKERLADTRLADDQRVQAVGRIEYRRLGLLDLTLEAPVRADEPRKGVLRLRRRLRLADGLDVIELAGSLAELHAEHRLQAGLVEVQDRTARELHDLPLAVQRIELLRDIVAQDIQRVCDLLRIEPDAPLDLVPRPGRRLLLDVCVDAFPSLHSGSPPCINTIYLLL